MLGCSNPDCQMYRCGDCRHNFVELKNQICKSCNPHVCDECRKISGKYFRKDDVKVPYDYQKVCATCLNLAIAVPFKRKRPVFMGEGRYPTGLCKTCSEDRILNEEGICKKCHEQHYEVEACVECRNYFTPRMFNQVLCDKCRPHCDGCGGQFNPLNKRDYLCAKCASKSGRGEGTCAKCGEYSTYLNRRAHCGDCQIKVERFDILDDYSTKESYCGVCRSEKVYYPERICKYCEGSKIICPDCQHNRIDATDYICTDCIEIRKEKYGR